MYKLPENLDSKYEFVTIASKRAQQLQTGAMPRVTGPSRKVTVIAQQEVAMGAVAAADPAELEPEEALPEEE